MVVKKSKLISTALVLTLAIPSVFASNNLVQMDLKKSSSDSVDVTLFTSNQYNDNVLVRKKSDNKYVILIPKVQSSGFSRAGLNGVRDLISDVDIKTVNDTTGGYTKVTLITTKPVDIKTRTQKSAPITQEQEEYQTLIAQANVIKNNIGRQSVMQTPQKTEVTVNKSPSNSNSAKSEQVTAKSTVNKLLMEPIQKNITTSSTNKPQIQLTEINPEEVQKQNRKEYLERLIEDAKAETDVLVTPQETNNDDNIDSHTPDEINLKSEVTAMHTVKRMFKDAMPKRLPKPLLFILPILGLILLVKTARNNRNENLAEGQKIIIDDISSDNSKYENITGNNELSWQEKYKLYLDKSAVPVPRANNKGTYTFIKNIAVEADNIEAKRSELEKMITNPEPEIIDNTVQAEDEVIHKTIKFKAFENTTSMDMTRRGIKSRFKKYEVELPANETNTELGKSSLHTNPRNLKDANLKVSDVDEKRIKYEPKEYIMSSVDEYFSLIDKEETSKISNPITASKEGILFDDNLIVNSRFDIDTDRGFYMINKDGQNMLVGKVKDEVSVLKNFGTQTSPLQVRHDSANVYMVKADGFKSLVEVNEDKMGVLIEL